MSTIMSNDDVQRSQELSEAINRAHHDEDIKARACVDELLNGNSDLEVAFSLARKSQEARDRGRALSAELRELFAT